MRYGRFPILRYLVPVVAVGLGVVAFLPGSENPVGGGGEAVASSDAGSTAGSSYLMASPQLMAELDAALSPPPVVGDPAAREALLPDPTTMTTQVAAVSTPAEVPAAEPANAVHIGGKAVNLRVGPSKTTAKVATLQPGQAVTLGEVNNGWAYVTTPTGESGWVYSSYLNGAVAGGDDPTAPTAETVAARDTEEPEQREDGQYARVRGDTVLRAGPSRTAQRLFVLPAGERVAIAEVDGRWARVVLKSGASGWLPIR